MIICEHASSWMGSAKLAEQDKFSTRSSVATNSGDSYK